MLNLKNTSYKKFKTTLSDRDQEYLKQTQHEFEKLKNKKLIEFFEHKKTNDFQNTQKFWQFHHSLISIKSDKSGTLPVTSIKHQNELITNKTVISNLFNKHFTSLSSTSTASYENCVDFNIKHFDYMKKNNILPSSTFEFGKFSLNQVKDAINSLSSSSSPGDSDVPTKVLKTLIDKLAPAITT